MSQQKSGILFAIGAYIIWGIFPIYWKLIEDVNSMEVLLNRIIWSFIMTFILIGLIGKLPALRADCEYLWKNKKQLLSLFAASLIISVNWFTYIWAVQNGHILQTSLGYYMNPLLSILFGVLFFREKLSKAVLVSVAIATIGVLYMVWTAGVIPWVALVLAFSFATYGVLKKQIQLDALRGLAIETALIVPLALIAYAYLASTTPTSLFQVDAKTNILLILSGIATALPLIFFAKGAQSMPLYMLGFIQFLAPTISFMLGVFLYKEPFDKTQLVTFTFIWMAVALFSVSTYMQSKKKRI